MTEEIRFANTMGYLDVELCAGPHGGPGGHV